ncbi:tyrosine-protein kinase Dnt-like [Arctopsyche grandis]|uniref:tyrosine-protein kinase Dnt-like n=1 Tax=Arctopsyche grandis TaxID=121162 RepID=UPI00406D8FEC
MGFISALSLPKDPIFPLQTTRHFNINDVYAATKIQTSLLISEGALLANFSHENLLTPLGICLATGSTRPLLIYPHCSYGNLKKFLLERRCATGVGVHLVALAVGAARGLVYLHASRIVHRDVATRNCVIDENLQVKIADNALSRDLFPEDYHCLCDSENRPIKWMALEALQHAQFSSSSDVWSFGVLLWELATFAQQPYAEVDPFEVGVFLRDGYRLTQPVNCPDELFTVMSCCWLTATEARPSLVQLLAFLQDFETALAQYI